MCGLRSIKDVVVRTLIHPPHPTPRHQHSIKSVFQVTSTCVDYVVSRTWSSPPTAPHPPHPPNHILSMCGHHENRNAYTVVEIRVTMFLGHKNGPITVITCDHLSLMVTSCPYVWGWQPNWEAGVGNQELGTKTTNREPRNVNSPPHPPHPQKKNHAIWSLIQPFGVWSII